MKANRLLAAVLICSCFFSGCVYTSPVNIISSHQAIAFRDEARNALGALFEAYATGTRGAFEPLIHEEFSPDKYSFLSETDAAMSGERVLETHFFIHTVNQAKNRAAVTCRWEKKAVPVGSQAPILKTGTAEFIFNTNGSDWRLIRIRGAHPFEA
jgi:hypothetical protein